MARIPIALRIVPLMTKWSPEILAQLLIDRFEDGTYLLTANEWVKNRPARIVSPDTMQESLRGLDSARDMHAKIARFPAHYFVWSDELETAYATYHHYVSSPEDLDAHDAFDIDPAIHPYEDLLKACPVFLSNLYLTAGEEPSKKDLRKQQTKEKHAHWQARADDLHSRYPDKTRSDIAGMIRKEITKGKKPAKETIRRIIHID